MNHTQSHGANSQIFLGLFLGLGACITAVLAAGFEIKLAIAVILGLAFLVVVLHFSTYRHLVNLAIIFLALGIPFNLDYNLLYREYIGVTSVDIGVSFLCALALYVLFFYHHATLPGRREPLFHSSRAILWAPLFYMVAGVLSIYNAVSRELVILELVRLVTLFLILFIVMNLQNRQQVSLFVFSLSVGLVLETLIALYQYYTGQSLGLDVFGEKATIFQNIGSRVSRTTGTIGHSNILAYYFEMLIPLMLSMSLAEEKGRLKLWYFMAFGLGLVGILTTLSRGGWMTLPISLGLVLVVMLRRRLAERKTLVTLFVASMAFAVTISFMYPTIERRLIHDDYGSARSRIPLDKAAFSIVKQYPVFGVGLNNFAKIFQTYDQTGGSSVGRTAKIIVHNMYLGVWAEVGTVGLIAFLGIFAVAIFAPFGLLSKLERWQRGVAIGVSAGLAAQFIHAMGDPGYRLLMNTSMLFYSLMGLTGAVLIMYKRGNHIAKDTM